MVLNWVHCTLRHPIDGVGSQVKWESNSIDCGGFGFQGQVGGSEFLISQVEEDGLTKYVLALLGIVLLGIEDILGIDTESVGFLGASILFVEFDLVGFEGRFELVDLVDGLVVEEQQGSQKC